MKCYNCNSPKLLINVEEDAYICQECGYKHYKQYFFISHSHRDIEKVRIIRNVIEETFFYEPILFFLKCLSDETEVTDLIKREIEERIWFVYCKSENAEKSRYVQMEREYIKKLISEGKQIHVLEIDIDKYQLWDEECYNYIRQQIAYKIKKTNIFVSYSHYDKDISYNLIENLKNNGFTVFYDVETLTISGSWNHEIRNAVKKNSYKNGMIIMMCSEKSFTSKSIHLEIQSALDNNAFIAPVLLYKDTEQLNRLSLELFNSFPELLENQIYKIDLNNANRDIDLLIKQIIEF